MANDDEPAERIDLNAADERELTRIKGIDARRARLILEHRAKHGRFQSWEDFERIPGIGPALAASTRAAATLGGSGGAARREGSPRGELLVPSLAQRDFSSDGVSGEGDELDELEVLSSLARLDLEVALAYDVGAHASSEDPDTHAHLLRFRDDHLRHFDELNELIQAREGTPVGLHAPLAEHLLRSLAKLASIFGPAGVVVALLSNEQLTNSTYDMALELEWDKEVQEFLESGLADEKRHLNWLVRKEEALATYEAQPDAQA